MKNKSTLLVLMFAFLCLACNNDDNASNLNDPNSTGNNENTQAFINQYFGNETSRSFLGTVIDKNRNPIEGVLISIGGNTASTDSNGVFIISDASVNERFAYIKAEKAGYIHASRAVVPSQGTNKVTIMMLEDTIVGATSSGTSEIISMDNGASVSLQGDYIKADGTSYDGNVDVIMHFLDPTDEGINDQMPGMLYAANSNNEERMLQTFGMLAVELRGSGGEDLNLAEGSTAEITVPLDPSLVTNAPATIPLWYFDEASGYWKEEGQATLVGNTYVGTVAHFSFWNCDIPAEAINLCITITDESNKPLTNLQLTITSSLYGTTHGSTNEIGEVCGLVPSNEVLVLNLHLSGICGNVSLQTENIGPFAQDSMVTIVLNNNPDFINETVIGEFKTCDGDPVTEGYVNLNYGGQNFIDVIDNGNFEINLIRCSNENNFTIRGADYASFQMTDNISYTFITPLTNIGTLSACNSVEEFIQYKIDNNDTVTLFENILASLHEEGHPLALGPALQIYAPSNSIGGNNCLSLYGTLNPDPFIGTYDVLVPHDSEDTGMFITSCFTVSSLNNNIIYNLNSFGEVGEYIDLNFSGDYEDYQGNAHTITAVIHVLRDQ